MKELPGGGAGATGPFAASLGLAGREGFAAAAAAGLPFLSAAHMAAAAGGGGQPPFGLHHFVDPRGLPFSAGAAAAGAFRPFLTYATTGAGATAATTTAAASSESSVKSSFGSAFQPPSGGGGGNNKVESSKGSPPTLFSPGQNLFPRASSAGRKAEK